MNVRSSGDGTAYADIWNRFLSPISSGIAWITDDHGHVVAGTTEALKNPIEELEEVLPKHKTELLAQEKWKLLTYFDLRQGLHHPLSGLFSCRQIVVESQVFFLFQKVNPQNELRISKEQLIAEEFGIYAWHFHLASNRFFFSPEGAQKFFKKLDTRIQFDDFFASLAPESLQKFSEAMESAINFGKGFRQELMLENGNQYQWISFSCQATQDGNNSPWLTGFIRDLQSEKTEESRRHQMDLWLNVGVSKMEVRDAGGEILAEWGNHFEGPNVKIEDGKRSATLFDFRNQPKYQIVTEIGVPPKVTSEPLMVPPPEAEIKPISEIVSVQAEKEEPQSSVFQPIDQLNKEEKCVALTQWLGQSLDAQISALGIFDGSRFEWKAWWKSPNRFALPVRKYSGEWLPELDWLVDVETDNKKFSDRYWWPQDMLPFQISESFGDGWMVLAEPISQKETSVFAIKTSDPEGLKEKTRHVLKSLEVLKDGPVMPVMETVDELKAELARKDMLIREINHRAKNNLALAASLVKMEAGFSSDIPSNQILKQTQKRLETLASIHELLYMGPGTSGEINMKDYLGQIAHGLMKGFGQPNVRLELHIDSAILDMKVANTIGLLVNELMSNAFKHAFSSEKDGVLKVDFFERPDSFKLRVSDNGPGLQSTKAKDSSLGNILIDEFVKQLHGTMEIDSTHGTTYLISIKKSTFSA